LFHLNVCGFLRGYVPNSLGSEELDVHTFVSTLAHLN
jgi:hypothetical protein